MNQRLRRPALAVTLGIVFSLALPLLPAVGLHSVGRHSSPPDPVMEIGSTARLVGNGAGVVVRLRIQCPRRGFTSAPSVSVTQSHLLSSASGRDVGPQPVCDRRPRAYDIVVDKDTFDPFLPEIPTRVTAFLWFCWPRGSLCTHVRESSAVYIPITELVPLP